MTHTHHTPRHRKKKGSATTTTSTTTTTTVGVQKVSMSANRPPESYPQGTRERVYDTLAYLYTT